MKTIETIRKQINSLEQALAANSVGLLGTFANVPGDESSCIYFRESTGNMCAVGSMLPKELIDTIISKDANNRDISYVDTIIGESVITEQTGFTITQLRKFQEIHDEWRDIDSLVHRYEELLDELYAEYNKALNG